MITINNPKDIKTKDLEFLVKLDRKLHEVSQSTFTPNISGTPFKVSYDTYTKKSMNKKEARKILNIIERNNLALYPINTSMGFSVGFQIANPNTKKSILTFKESQLPENYNFKTLSKYFMQQENIEKSKSLGISIVNNYNHYDY